MIERNIRLEPHQSKDLLVSRRSDGKRPKYQPPGYGSSSAHDSGSRGNTGASHDRGGRQHQAAAAPAPAPSRVSPMQSIAMTGNTSLAGKTQSDAQASVDRDNAIKAAEGKVDVGFQEVLRKQKIAEDLKNTLDTDFLFEEKKVVAPKVIKPTIKTYERGTPFSQGLIKTVTPPKVSSTYYQDRSKIGGKTYGERAEAGIKRGGGINKLLNIASMAMPFVKVPQKVATGVRMAKAYSDIKNRKGIFGTALRLGENLTDKNIGDFIKTGGSQLDIFNPNEMKNVKTVKPIVERDGKPPTVVEAISGQKSSLLTPRMIKLLSQVDPGILQRTYERGKPLFDAGKLSGEQLNFFKLLEEYLV